MLGIDIAKAVGGIVISSSVGTIIGNVVKASTPETIKASEKIMIVIGTFAISTVVGGLVADQTIKIVEDMVKPLGSMYAKVKHEEV